MEKVKRINKESEKGCITYKSISEVKGKVRTIVVNFTEGWYIKAGSNVEDFGEVRIFKIRELSNLGRQFKRLNLKEFDVIERI